MEIPEEAENDFGRDDDDNAAFPVNDFDNYGVEQPA